MAKENKIKLIRSLRNASQKNPAHLAKGVSNLTLNFLVAKWKLEIIIIYKIQMVKNIRQVI